MHKRVLHHTWTKLRPFGAIYFLAAAVMFLVIGAYSVRQNNLTAIDLRKEVSRVDEQNGDVETALRELRMFIYSHMNSELGGGASNVQQPVQLKYRYERLVETEKNRVSA